jgi:hypothetical protein
LTLQEKYYPGDRVSVLVRVVKEETVDTSRWTEKRKREHLKALADAKHAASDAGLWASADRNGDGVLDAGELEALAKDVPRGRTGVVCKFPDGGNRVVVEFDDEVGQSPLPHSLGARLPPSPLVRERLV